MASPSDKQRDRNVPRRNTVREARNASNRPKIFYIVLATIALVGLASLYAVSTKSKPGGVEAAAVGVDTANAGQSQGYLMGNADAPVKILEFADFECPGCASFATITEPDVRKRIIDTGLANITYYDYPLPQHRNTVPASNAAACADEQGKFWAMHDRIFAGQNEWNTQATDSPKAFFARYARELGLDMSRWEPCYDTSRHQKRIAANLADGMRRKVNTTPTFIIGNRMYTGALNYDELKAIVDSTARTAAATTPTPASGTPPAAAR